MKHNVKFFSEYIHFLYLISLLFFFHHVLVDFDFIVVSGDGVIVDVGIVISDIMKRKLEKKSETII